MRASLTIAALSVLGLSPHARANSIVWDTAIVIGADSPGPYWISGFFIIRQSESVTVDHVVCASHILDYDAGRITFIDTLCSTDTAVVVFQRLGFALASRWMNGDGSDAGTRHVEVTPVSYTVQAANSPSPVRDLPSPTRLQWQGFKSFAVTASEGQDAGWSQGTELSVSGELFHGLRLSGALTDRQVSALGTPYRRDGSRLGDLDRFYIEAQSVRFYGRWGELRLGGMNPPRRVSGLQTRIVGPRHSFQSHIARPAGQTQRTRITLRDGELGPYSLAASSAHAQIVDGSQTVWLDGSRLAEGPDADYTLDAARGTISLTPRVHFSRQSTLVAEYEETLDDYQRTMAGAGWGWASLDSTRMNSLQVTWEGDDPSRPLFGELTAEQRDLLATDSDGSVSTLAAEHVGDDDGDYHLEILPEGDSIFVYAGPEQGDWNVRFEWAGEGQGSYRHLIDDAFEYVGDQKGSYRPTITFGAPSSRFVVDESMKLSVSRLGAFSVDWQGLGLDPNRFAAGSSEFKSNHLLVWRLTSRDDPGATSLGLHWLRHEQRAETRDLAGLAPFVEAWRLRSDPFTAAFDDYTASGSLPAARWFLLRTETGHFSNLDLSGWRASAGSELRPVYWLALQPRIDHRWVEGASDQSTTARYQITTRAERGVVGAEIGWSEETVDDAAGHFSYDARFNATRWLGASYSGIGVRQEWRKLDEVSASGTERAQEFSVAIPISILQGTSGAGLTLLRGERAAENQEARPYYGGRLSGTWSISEDAQIAADMNLLHRRAGSQDEVFIPTRPGQGDYRLERGEYIPDPHGDYRRLFVDDETAPSSVYDAARMIRIAWRPHWRGWRWTIDASRRVDARYDSRIFSPYDWMMPWKDLRDALVPGGQLTQRDDDRLVMQPRTQSRLTFAFAHSFRHSNSSDPESIPNEQRQWRVESEWREDLLSTVYLAAGAQYHRHTRNGAQLSQVDSDARVLLATLGFSPMTGLGFSLETRRRIDREFHADQWLGLWGLKPGLRLNRGPFSGSVSTDLTWLAGVEAGALSPLLAEGRPVGFSVTEYADVRWQLPSRISLNARLSADHRPHEPDRWRMHLESIAQF